MFKPPRFPLPASPDDLAAVPLVLKDALRGLRQKWSSFTPDSVDRDGEHHPDHGLTPLALTTKLFREAQKIATFGEDIARDLVFRHRNEYRLFAFAGSGFGNKALPPRDLDHHDFVASRYAALKVLANHLGIIHPLILEQPIHAAYQTLINRRREASGNRTKADGPDYEIIAASVFALAENGAIRLDDPSQSANDATKYTFAALGLAESMLDLEPAPASLDTTLAALQLAADVIALRKPTILAIFDGFEPEAQLAAEFRLLAPHLSGN